MSAHFMLTAYVCIGAFLMGLVDSDKNDFGRALFVLALWPLVPLVLVGAVVRIFWQAWRADR